jgi:hypothetical protein
MLRKGRLCFRGHSAGKMMLGDASPIESPEPPETSAIPRQRPGILSRRQAFDPSRRRATALEFIAFFYLTAPLIIFFATFATPIVAGPALAVMLAVLYRARPQKIFDGLPDPRRLFPCMLAAAVYLWACGYLPPFGRTWDWIKHFAVMNELAHNSWPPINDATGTFLRYGLGYDLIPGLVAKLLGDRLIGPAVFLQTWIGLVLVLALLLEKIRPARPAIFLGVFLLFSGLDLVGWILFAPDLSIFAHKEWWTGPSNLFAYEGNATLFQWVPQHALGGMLGILLLLPDGEQSPPPQMLGLLGAAVAFWSPLAAFGLLPFALAVAAASPRAVFTDWGNLLCGLAVHVPLWSYLLAGSGGIEHGFNWQHQGFTIVLYVSFFLLEVGLYLMALWLSGWRHLRYPIIVIGILLLLPLYRVGIFNDFTMRASIPALTLIAIAAASGVTDAQGYRWIPLAVLLTIGSAASLLEIIGRGREPRVLAQGQTLRSGFLFDDPRFSVQLRAPLPNWMLRQ